MRLVLDTNILVSALFWDGAERRVLTGCLDGRHELVTSPFILRELQQVLVGKFGVPLPVCLAYVAGIAGRALVLDPPRPPRVVVHDRADDHVLACAVAGQAVAVVSGDGDLLALERYRGIDVVRAPTL